MKRYKTIVKLIFKVLGILLLAYCLWNYKLLVYGIRQGYGELKLVSNVKSVEEVLQDKAFPDSLKAKLRLIQEVRKYAVDSLGLKDSKNYTTIYDQKGKPILWVVKACPEFKMESYQWDFSIAGKYSYKGYFNKELAIEEHNRMKALGYDVRTGSVGGWSTLGILKDPILSNMLNETDGELAELIIHELTHATIYLKSSVQYNENLATFIGEKGAIRFLNYKYGIQSKEYRQYQCSHIDSETFYDHFLRGAKQLDSLYATFSPQMDIKLKRSKKEQMITSIIAHADSLHWCDSTGYQFLKQAKFKPNNVWFMSFRMYRADLGDFEKGFLECGSDFRKYIAYLKKTKK